MTEVTALLEEQKHSRNSGDRGVSPREMSTVAAADHRHRPTRHISSSYLCLTHRILLATVAREGLLNTTRPTVYSWSTT